METINKFGWNKCLCCHPKSPAMVLVCNRSAINSPECIQSAQWWEFSESWVNMRGEEIYPDYWMEIPSLDTEYIKHINADNINKVQAQFEVSDLTEKYVLTHMPDAINIKIAEAISRELLSKGNIDIQETTSEFGNKIYRGEVLIIKPTNKKE